MSNINLTKGASEKSILHQGFNFPKLTFKVQAKKSGQSTLEPLGTQLFFFHLIKYTIQNFLTISSRANGCFLKGKMNKSARRLVFYHLIILSQFKSKPTWQKINKYFLGSIKQTSQVHFVSLGHNSLGPPPPRLFPTLPK